MVTSKPYVLSDLATQHISEIADFTDATFGLTQTEAYLAGLEASFDVIARFPRIGVAVFEVGLGLRRYRFQSHHIYYSEEDENVLIIAVIHVRRQLRADLFDI